MTTQKHQEVYGYFIEINPLKVQSFISNFSRIRTVLSTKHSWRISFSKFQDINFSLFRLDGRQFLFVYVNKYF